MITIGVTGSIGMGKTTAAGMLRAMGYPVFCSDDAVHALMAPGGRGVQRVAAIFPAAFDPASASIDRKKLRAAIGNDHKAWDSLQAVLHPLVREEQKRFIESAQRDGAKIAVLDIPLLFETLAERRLDYTICVTASKKMQHERVLSRPGMSLEDFKFRLSRQMPDWRKRWKADFVVRTDKGLDHTRAALEKIVARLSR